MRRTTVIAEIGENHMGDWDLARRMVVAAAEAGADIVKFQSYLGTDVADDDPEKAWFTKVQLPDDLHGELKALAERHGVEFLSSPFTVDRARFLVERLGLRKIKVASSELVNVALLDYLNGRVDVVYLSTGMATLEEVGEAVGRLRRVPHVAILHCVTQYPTRDEDANLKAIETLREAFPGHAIGYSDHTIGMTAPVAAVALGASVIEKHFTLDRSLPGTDQILSATPEELRQLIRQIRQLEALLGSGDKRPVPAELSIREMVRHRFPKGSATTSRHA